MAIGDDEINWDEDAKRATKAKYPYTDGSFFYYFKDLIKPHMKVLEVGCQIASWYPAWRDIEPTIRYTGVDFSSYAIKVAQERYPNCKFYLMDARDIEFENKFDVVFTHTFFQHTNIQTKKIIIPKIWKALKPGGLCIIQENCTKDTETHFTRNGWINLFQSYGFKVIKVHDIGGGGCGIIFRKV